MPKPKQLFDEYVCTVCEDDNPDERCYLRCVVRKPVTQKGNSTIPRLKCENGDAVWVYVEGGVK